jgi:hypothetical protein
VRACFDGDEATVQRYLQGNDVNLDLQVLQCCAHFHQLTHTSMHLIVLRCTKLTNCCAVCKSLLFPQRSTHCSLVCMCIHAALSLPLHGEQGVSLFSSRSAALTAHSCVCACVSAIAWRTVRKFLLFPQRSTHSSLVCMCMHAALSLPSHGEQAVSLCSSRSEALTAHSCVCACMRRCLYHRMANSS